MVAVPSTLVNTKDLKNSSTLLDMTHTHKRKDKFCHSFSSVIEGATPSTSSLKDSNYLVDFPTT